MIAVVEQLGQDFGRVAPELIASPKHSLSASTAIPGSATTKATQTHAAAVFRHRDLPKPQGAGPVLRDCRRMGVGRWRDVAAGAARVVRIREHIAETWPRAIARPIDRVRGRVGELQGDTMSRVPRGYAADHPAADFLKHRQFYAGAEFPPRWRSAPSSIEPCWRTFKTLMPLVRFLNEPLIASSAPFGPEDRHAARRANRARNPYR